MGVPFNLNELARRRAETLTVLNDSAESVFEVPRRITVHPKRRERFQLAVDFVHEKIHGKFATEFFHSVQVYSYDS